MVADGNARIKIGPCGDAYWGMIDWAARASDIDQYNPDPAKRTRSVIGMPILLGMKESAPNEWSGEVYNAQNGNTYKAKITLVEPNVLKITGCVLGGLFCGGENWSRAKENEMKLTVPARPGAAPQANAVQNRNAAGSPPRAQTNAATQRGQSATPGRGQPPAARSDEVCPANPS
jgi:hypothetical protein